MGREYCVRKVMNNNVIMALDISLNQEKVLIGKGIGYKQLKNKVIILEDEEIEKCFFTYEKELKKDYISTVNEISGELLEICANIISISEEKIGELSKKLFIILVDHITFALERIKLGMDITNPFLYEIQSLYPIEFAIGEIARKKIYELTSIDLTQDEAGFIALHIYSAKNHMKISSTVSNTRLLKELMELIKSELKINYTNGILYNNILLQLKGMIDMNGANSNEVDDWLIGTIRERFKVPYNVSRMIAQKIEKKKGIKISNEHILYLTTDISRLILYSNKELCVTDKIRHQQ